MCKEDKGLPLAGEKTKGITSVDTNLGSQYPPKKVPFLEWEFQLMGPKDPSQESCKPGHLVPSTHCLDDETGAQRS